MPLWQATQSVARPAYYDRAAIPTIGQYNAAVAPHASTVRVQYSPAYPFAAFIENCTLLVRRNSVAAPLGRVAIQATIIPFFGGSTTLSIVRMFDNTVEATKQDSQNTIGYMAYGDTLYIVTSDGGTGGTVEYLGSYKGTEFLY